MRAILLSALVLFLSVGSGSCAKIGKWKENPLSCKCTDVDPRAGTDKHLKFVKFRCFEHFMKGDCEKSFMYNTIKELPEGFCQITCGRCDCCGTMRSVAQEEGLLEWVWAMEVAGLAKYLDAPGWEVAALAPRDGALNNMLSTFGWSKSDVENDEKIQRVVAEVLLFNTIKAIPQYYAVYNSPFITDGLSLTSEYDDITKIQVKKWDSGGTGFQGLHGSATVQDTDFDKATCKGYIHISDQYLLPFTDATELLEPPSDPGEVSGKCQLSAQTQYDGEVVASLRADNAEECCSACSKDRECNAWTWCARGVCSKSPEVTWGTCELKQSKSVAKGGNPDTIERDFMTPYHSGHISPRKDKSEDPKSG